jgi:hypothetical protein
MDQVSGQQQLYQNLCRISGFGIRGLWFGVMGCGLGIWGLGLGLGLWVESIWY